MAIPETSRDESVPDRLVVHGDMFYADDAMKAALLMRLNPDLKIEHVRGAAGPEDDGGYASARAVYEAFPQLRPENDEAAKWLERTLSDVEDQEAAKRLEQKIIDPSYDGDVDPITRTALCRLVEYSNPRRGDDVSVGEAFEDVVHEVDDNVIDFAMCLDRDEPASEVRAMLTGVDSWLADVALRREGSYVGYYEVLEQVLSEELAAAKAQGPQRRLPNVNVTEASAQQERGGLSY